MDPGSSERQDPGTPHAPPRRGVEALLGGGAGGALRRPLRSREQEIRIEPDPVASCAVRLRRSFHLRVDEPRRSVRGRRMPATDRALDSEITGMRQRPAIREKRRTASVSRRFPEATTSMHHLRRGAIVDPHVASPTTLLRTRGLRSTLRKGSCPRRREMPAEPSGHSTRFIPHRARRTLSYLPEVDHGHLGTCLSCCTLGSVNSGWRCNLRIEMRTEVRPP